VIAGLDEVLDDAVDLKFGARAEAEVETIHESGILVTRYPRKRKVRFAGVAEPRFHDEGAGRDEAGVFGQERTLLGETATQK
jgi:hypothetical protein